MEFGSGAGDSSQTLREGQRGIFNIHKLIPADLTPSLTSIRGGGIYIDASQTLMKVEVEKLIVDLGVPLIPGLNPIYSTLLLVYYLLLFSFF